MSRPLKLVDARQVRALASIGCPVADMAKVLGCSTKTLERRFMKEMELGRAERNTSLRRRQFELAMDGNPTMLIWLGKQYLGQREKHEFTDGDGTLLRPPNMIVEFVTAEQVRAERALTEEIPPGKGLVNGEGTTENERQAQ